MCVCMSVKVHEYVCTVFGGATLKTTFHTHCASVDVIRFLLSSDKCVEKQN